jgi:iron complex outermembrane receptor protein
MQACRLARAIVVTLTPFTVGALAQAQTILEEVVVSAQKREQNIQDVGIAIAAFTGDQLKAMGIESSYDIATFTPGVHISGAMAGQNSQFTIRGVTQSDFNDIVEAPNAVYLDEGYIPIANAQTFGLFDIERVEVLKGPQGTLFGRNATGGLVHYISRKPNFG